MTDYGYDGTRDFWIFVAVFIPIMIALVVVVLMGDHSKSDNTPTETKAAVVQKPKPYCTKSHDEVEHHSSWTQFIYIPLGKSFILSPIVHPAYDSNKTVCDKWSDQ